MLLRFLMRLYQRQIDESRLPERALPLPDPHELERQEAMRQAVAARERAHQIIRSLQEQKNIGPA